MVMRMSLEEARRQAEEAAAAGDGEGGKEGEGEGAGEGTGEGRVLKGTGARDAQLVLCLHINCVERKEQMRR